MLGFFPGATVNADVLLVKFSSIFHTEKWLNWRNWPRWTWPVPRPTHPHRSSTPSSIDAVAVLTDASPTAIGWSSSRNCSATSPTSTAISPMWSTRLLRRPARSGSSTQSVSSAPSWSGALRRCTCEPSSTPRSVRCSYFLMKQQNDTRQWSFVHYSVHLSWWIDIMFENNASSLDLSLLIFK